MLHIVSQAKSSNWDQKMILYLTFWYDFIWQITRVFLFILGYVQQWQTSWYGGGKEHFLKNPVRSGLVLLSFKSMINSFKTNYFWLICISTLDVLKNVYLTIVDYYLLQTYLYYFLITYYLVEFILNFDKSVFFMWIGLVFSFIFWTIFSRYFARK